MGWNLCCVVALGLTGLVGASALVKEDKHYWASAAKRELDAALGIKWNQGLAKNIILFVGDGMGPTTVTAARLYKGNGNEQTKLKFEEFPHVGFLKTYCTDKQVPDSASTATALFCGVKTNYRTLGVDVNVKNNDCEASLNPKYWVNSILQWAQEAGKDTGFVTTTRVTHATPGALYAHTAERTWECEATMPSSASKCKDIARQLIEDDPGRNIKVIMGGGRQVLVSGANGTEEDPIDQWACLSKDGRDLIQKWKEDKTARHFVSRVLSNNEDLDTLDIRKTDFVLGIFANGHLNYQQDQNKGPTGTPSIAKMTSSAIKILQKSSTGFLLVVEGGLIDMAHHRGMAQRALYEAVAMDDAVAAAVASTTDQSDTLVIVTSDHTHTLSMSGYAKRGSSILGLAGNSKVDHIPYTILAYGTGDKYGFKYSVSNQTEVVRENPENENYTSSNYHQHAGIITDEATHGGGDVAVYATGPMAHLFHATHEQSYVAYVIGYAAKIGPYSTGHASLNSINFLLYLLVVMAYLF